MKKLLLAFVLFLAGCVRVPENVRPVSGFDLNRYLGTWYEIARLDHSFERGLTKVSAQYSLREGGGVRVLNRGYNAAKGEWKQAVGKARFVRSADEGFLKVSFFGPFYGSYVIVELDKENYSYALVCGPDRSYLWLLSRTPVMDAAVKARLTARASELGFDTEKLIFVEQGE
jgi:apolipoprotein D and lipocalin family protein